MAGETSGASRTTLDTVDFETPASAATSRIVGAFSMRGEEERDAVIAASAPGGAVVPLSLSSALITPRRS